jgi:hypothetical protein
MLITEGRLYDLFKSMVDLTKKGYRCLTIERKPKMQVVSF